MNLEHRKSQAAIVYPGDDHVPVRLGYRRTLAGQVDNLQRRMTHGLIGVVFCCWVGGGCHWVSLPQSLSGRGKKKLSAVNPGYPLVWLQSDL
jgi:hypothetical protein